MRLLAVLVLASSELVAAPACPPSLDKFTFSGGKPETKLRSYMVARWGEAADRAFRSPATTRQAGPFTLLALGRYAVVELPAGGFYLRDFGERGTIEEITSGPSPGEIVVSYAIDDHEPPAAETTKNVTSLHHTIYELWVLDPQQPPRIEFIHEQTAAARCCGSEANAPPHVRDEITFGAQDIQVRFDNVWRATAPTFHETPLPEVPAVLTPWSGPRSVTYRRGACVFEPVP